MLTIDLAKTSRKVTERCGSNLRPLKNEFSTGHHTSLNRENLNQKSEMELKGAFQNRKKYSLVNILEKNIPVVKK